MAQRWAAIDIGTNSVRLLICEKENGRIKGEKKVCITRLGEGLSKEKHLTQEAMQRTEQAVLQFAKEAVSQGAEGPVWCYATSAARQADNGLAFLQRLTDSGLVRAELLSGEEEAQAAYLGSQAKGRPVLDVGGGSTELTIQKGACLNGQSIPLGCVTLKEQYMKTDRMETEQKQALRAFCKSRSLALTEKVLCGQRAETLIAVGGTATQLAMLTLGLPAYDANRVHGFQLTKEQVETWYDTLTTLSGAERRALPGMEAKRADVIVCGTAIIAAVMENCGAGMIQVSDKDGLDGYLQRKMEMALDK